MHFNRSQMGLMRNRLSDLKSKVLPKHLIDPKIFLADNNSIKLGLIRQYGPAIALQWCLDHEFFACQENADLASTTLDADLGGLGMDISGGYKMEDVDWEFTPLIALMKDHDATAPVHPEPQPDNSRFWFSPSWAIDLMNSQREEAEVMLASLAI